MGADVYEARIIEQNIPGRQSALDLEQSLVNDYARKNFVKEGVYAGPPNNIRPKPTPI